MSTAFVTMWDEATNTSTQEYVQFSARGKKSFGECYSRVIAAACKAFNVKRFKAASVIPVGDVSFVTYGFVDDGCVVFCAKGHW